MRVIPIKKNLWLGLILALGSGIPWMPSALAAPSGTSEGYSLGILVGPALEGNGDGDTLGFEGKLGYRGIQGFSASVYYWRFTSGATVSDSSSTIASTNTLSAFGFEGLLNISGTFWWLGAKIGLLKNTETGTASNGSQGANLSVSSGNSTFSVAPTAIYEISDWKFRGRR